MRFLAASSVSANVTIPEYEPRGCNTAYDLFIAEAKKGANSKFLVYYDPDIDGLLAGYLVERFLEKLNLPSEHKINSNRVHGFRFEEAEYEKYKGYTIIAVDFSILPAELHKILLSGINIINIDHHEISEDFMYLYSKETDCYGVVLNNQYSFEPSEFRFLSGAGMVYYVLQYILSTLNGEKMDWDAVAMVGVTLLSDIRETESIAAQSFLLTTFNISSDYFKYLQWLVASEDYSSAVFEPFGMPTMNRNFIDFNFSPILNSLLRANKSEVAVGLIKGEDKVIRENRLLLHGYRGIQKDIISRIVKGDGFEIKKMSNLQVCCIPSTFDPYPGYGVTNYIGVACSQFKDEDKSGFVFVKDVNTGNIIRGSVRGSRDGVDYLNIFNRNGAPSAGHQSAFGVLSMKSDDIDLEKINAEIAEAEEKIGDTTSRTVMEVRNLSLFLQNNSKCWLMNTLVRDNHRFYIDYKGDLDNVVASPSKSGKMVTYTVDGIKVKSFDPSLDLTTGYILAMYERGTYIECTLKKKFI